MAMGQLMAEAVRIGTMTGAIRIAGVDGAGTVVARLALEVQCDEVAAGGGMAMGQLVAEAARTETVTGAVGMAGMAGEGMAAK